MSTEERLDAKDVKWFSQSVFHMYGCLSERELFSTSGAAIHLKFRSAVTAIEEVSADFSSFALHSLHGSWSPPPWYAAAIADNPIARHVTGSPQDGTFRNSELVSRQELESTHAHNLIFRPAGLRDIAMAASHVRPDTACGLALSRDSKFKEAESHLLEFIRRHFRAALLRLRRSSRATGVIPLIDSILHLQRDGRPVWLSAPMTSLLKTYFPSDSAAITACRLPENLRRWYVSSLKSLSNLPDSPPLTFFKAECARGTLLVRLFPAQPNGGSVLRATEVLRQPNPFALQIHGLSPRECEVLYWVGLGERDAEIARQLSIAPRTVGKHVENILSKLGVENRLSAVRWARGLI